jgi:hypothetical protein
MSAQERLRNFTSAAGLTDNRKQNPTCRVSGQLIHLHPTNL